MASKVEFNIPDYTVMLNNAVEKTVDEVAAIIEGEAKRTAPVDTGNFRNQIKYDKSKGQVIANAEYSAALEYGVKNTRRQPRPTLRNAARYAQKKVNATFKRNFG